MASISEARDEGVWDCWVWVPRLLAVNVGEVGGEDGAVDAEAVDAAGAGATVKSAHPLVLG